MGLDQIPVDSVPEQRIDVFVTNVLIGAEELVFAPVADARHQLDAQQMRKAEHGSDCPCVSAWTVSGWMSEVFFSRPSMI